MALKLITAPSTLAVSLIEAKAHLRVDSSDEDTLITALITAATETAEQITGRAIMPQTWEMTTDNFPDNEFLLTRIPALSVTSLEYVNEEGMTVALDSDLYHLDNSDDFGFAKVTPSYGLSFPTIDNTLVLDWVDYFASPYTPRYPPGFTTLRYVAGYANAAAVPESIKSWIKLTVSSMYENREAEAYSSRAVSTTVKMSFVDGLLDRYRVWA